MRNGRAMRALPQSDLASSAIYLLVLFVAAASLVAGLAGCGSSSGGPSVVPTATTQPTPTVMPTPRLGSLFVPVMPPLSPDTVGYSPSQQRPVGLRQSRPVAMPAATQAPIVLDHFFYLVNGVDLPTPAPDGVAPQPSSTPYVLTVNGTAPAGAPNPNGGTGVTAMPMNPEASGTQLWKAVAATNGGYFYLRSAESFQTNNNAGLSLLLGFAQKMAALDLGFYSNWNTSIYWNQSNSPTGDNSAFQQWSYDTANAQLTNLNAGGQLYYSSSAPTALVAQQAPNPSDQWYAYPNYFLETVVNEPPSNPSFPTPEATTISYPTSVPSATATTVSGQTDANGECAAYNYVSNVVLCAGSPSACPASQQTCTLENTTFNGIRCQYNNLNAAPQLSNCVSDTSPLPVPPANPGMGACNGTTYTISAADWYAVYSQLHKECEYASDVQTLYGNFGAIANAIFTQDGDTIASLATDVGLAESQSLNAVPIDIIEGLLYTALSATGATGVAVFANVMETAVNTALAQGGQGAQNLTQALATTVGNLYSDLNSRFVAITDQTANGENAILGDWGRLSQIGPLTEINGYNGLGLNAAQFSTIEEAALKGYSLAVMQVLMPVAPWALYSYAATTSSAFGSTPSSAQYSYYTFGSNTQNYNNNYLAEPGPGDYPSQQVIDTDILGNGGNSFELFNGLNGWARMASEPVQNLDCDGFVVTLFNATPSDMSVTVTPNEGLIAAPGYNFVATMSGTGGVVASGSDKPTTLELRPYGYLPIYAAANSGTAHLNVEVDVFVNGSQIASFNYGVGHACTRGDDFGVTQITAIDGYAFSPNPFATQLSGNGSSLPWSGWSTIINSSLQPQ